MDETHRSPRGDENPVPHARFEDIRQSLLSGALFAIVAEYVWPMGHICLLFCYIVLRIWSFKEMAPLLPLFIFLFGDRLLEPQETSSLITANASVTGYIVTITTLRGFAIASSILLKWRSLHIVLTVVTGFNVIVARFLPSNVSLRLQEMQGRRIIQCLNLAFEGWLRLSKRDKIPLRFSRPLTAVLKQLTFWVSGLPPIEQLPDFDYGDVRLNGPRQIRLLQLQRRVPFREIEARLVTDDIRSGTYDCISYVWGDERELTHAIRLNNKRFPVRANVHQILSRQASYWRRKFIWIDGICINQQDETDKTSQVLLMTDIYARATRVFLCLGDPPNATLGVLALYWMRLMRRYTHPDTHLRYMRHIRALKRDVAVLDAAWQEFVSLFYHTWFQRVWIVQELALARYAIVSYGRYWFSWDLFVDDMAAAASDFGPVGGVSMLDPDELRSSKNMHPFAAANGVKLKALRGLLRQGRSPSLSEVLVTFMDWRAKEPKDKLYALFGLTDDTENLKTFIIGYKEEDRELLCRVAGYFVERRDHLLDLLCFAGIGWGTSARNPKHNDGLLPSWVPDWTTPRTPASLGVVSNQSTRYSSGIQRPLQLTRFGGTESLVLKFQGTSLDTLGDAGPAVDFDFGHDGQADKLPDAIITWLGAYERFCRRWAPDPYHNGDAVSNVISKMLIGDRTETSRPAPPDSSNDYLERLKARLQAASAVIRSYPGKDASTANRDEWQKRMQRQVDDHPIIKTWGDELGTDLGASWIFGNPSFPRCVYATAKNRYLVGAPVGSEPGDIVVAVFGARVPFVLRPIPLEKAKRGQGQASFCTQLVSDEIYNQAESEGHEFLYSLVGECYVHGVMDGEALRPGDNGTSFLIV